jgi:hypothetical protein
MPAARVAQLRLPRFGSAMKSGAGYSLTLMLVKPDAGGVAGSNGLLDYTGSWSDADSIIFWHAGSSYTQLDGKLVSDGRIRLHPRAYAGFQGLLFEFSRDGRMVLCDRVVRDGTYDMVICCVREEPSAPRQLIAYVSRGPSRTRWLTFRPDYAVSNV